MKAMAILVFVGALSAYSGLNTAHAAVTCVENKSTGRFDEKSSSRLVVTGECDAQSAMNRASSLADMDAVASSGGTKMIDGVILTNAAQPFGALGNTKRSAEETKVPVAASTLAEPARKTKPPAPPVVSNLSTHVALAAVPNTSELAKAAIPTVPDTKTWDVRITDGTVYGTLKRWSKEAGMQLIWETENHDLRLRGQASYPGKFDAAVAELMKSVGHSDYPMRACIYDNGAVRVIHTKKSCKD